MEKVDIHTLINFRSYKEIKNLEKNKPHLLPVSKVGRKRRDFCTSIFNHELRRK